MPRIASRQRGAWIETFPKMTLDSGLQSIASRQRGAWIETGSTTGQGAYAVASPLGNEGRGLKPRYPVVPWELSSHHLSATGGVD